jgi:DNA invertase Pin-like site-specific DNA recombinase
MTLKAFSYLRVSGLSQTAGDGFPRQRAAILEYAAKNDLEIVEEFAENGVSGTTDLDDRPALGALLAALEANGIKTIVCEKIDRLARDLLIQETIIGDMQRHGYTLVSTMEPDLCSTDPSRVFIRQVFGALAQYDRATLTAKMAAAKVRKRKADPTWSEGKKPFGILEGEAETLALMRSYRADGWTFQRIATVLNQEGKLSRSGKSWAVGTVAKILAR